METRYIRLPFEVEKAKRITNGSEAGKIVTRDGCDVRIICWDSKSSFPIVALISNNFNDSESCEIFTLNGSYVPSEDSHLDLFISVPEWTTFKDGDIIAYDNCGTLSIINADFKSEDDCITSYSYVTYIPNSILYDIENQIVNTARLATEKEKETLFEKLKNEENEAAKKYLKRFFNIVIK